MLAELQPTAPAAQACAKGGSCSRGDSEDPAVLLGEQPKAKNSEPPVVKDKRNTPPLKLNSRQLRNLKSKLRSLVARKAPGKLTKVNRWIKVLPATGCPGVLKLFSLQGWRWLSLQFVTWW